MRQRTPMRLPRRPVQGVPSPRVWRRANAKRVTVGKPCATCRKIRTTEDGNHPGYCVECLYWWRIKRVFGLDRSQYAAMLSTQGNCCAICGRSPEGSYPGMLHVDHCHDTGKVRGLLCQVCNLSLGKFQHDPDLLRRAAEYLEAPASV
jgi:hypothetical protein